MRLAKELANIFQRRGWIPSILRIRFAIFSTVDLIDAGTTRRYTTIIRKDLTTEMSVFCVCAGVRLLRDTYFFLDVLITKENLSPPFCCSSWGTQGITNRVPTWNCASNSIIGRKCIQVFFSKGKQSTQRIGMEQFGRTAETQDA